MLDNTGLFWQLASQIPPKIDPIITQSSSSSWRAEFVRSLHRRALLILAHISELRDLVVKNRKRYLPLGLCQCTGSGKDEERFEGFDSKFCTAMQQCSALIHALETSLGDMFPAASASGCQFGDTTDHFSAVISSLRTYLRRVAAIFVALKSIHLKKSKQLRSWARLSHLVAAWHDKLEHLDTNRTTKTAARTSAATPKHSTSSRTMAFFSRSSTSELLAEIVACGRERLLPELRTTSMDVIEGMGWEVPSFITQAASAMGTDRRDDGTFTSRVGMEQVVRLGELLKREDASTVALSTTRANNSYASSNVSEYASIDGLGELSREEQVKLDSENENLLCYLVSSEVQYIGRIEQQLVEMQALQDTFSEKVVEQYQGIGRTHANTINVLDNLEEANRFLKATLKSRRAILMFFLLVLTLTLLFLHWYNP